jgi:hypothetical protein
LDQYGEAEALAFENFNKHKNNPFYIQAYFKCLINRHTYSVEKDILRSLIDRISDNPHPRAKDMKLVMEAQLDYYVNGDLAAAEMKLKQSLHASENNKNAFNVLFKIYQKEDHYKGLEYLTLKFGDKTDSDTDE